MISSFDPLDHPELQANRVALKDVKGEVNGAGSVTLTWAIRTSRSTYGKSAGRGLSMNGAWRGRFQTQVP